MARRLLGLAAVLSLAAGTAWPSPPVTPDQVASLLATLHADYAQYIGSVRYGSSRLRPATLYAGLVRRGGLDPRDPQQGPRAGRGVRNDLIIYTDTFEHWRTPAWRLLVADHEYYHARHLARAADAPMVGFGDAAADSSYQEALAWGYVLRRAGDGVYGTLTPVELAEARHRYADHHAGFRAFVMRRQPSAWAHYGRFLPEPSSLVTRAASGPTADSARPAGRATR